jgi:hypothetical protein
MTLDLLQWPAAILGLGGGWLVASRVAGQRRLGFALWIVSNVLWVVWATSTHAWALLGMQSVFLVTSVRGWINNREPAVDRLRSGL